MVADLSGNEERPHDWQLRRWALAALGVLIGLAIHHILTPGDTDRWTEDATQVAFATFLGVSGIAFAFVVERGRITGSAIFAVIAGLVVASVLYWSGDFTSWEPWRLVSALLTVAIAAPLFQGWRDGGSRRWRIPYVETHNRAWTNVCLWFAAWAFVGITFALAWLLATLFNLIGIDALEDMLKKEWFAMMLAGAAFGGAVGLLRDRERIVATFQRVVMMILAVLAPVLAVGLVLFLLALPFTGLDALWETTKSTTPILLSCIIGALILANAVIGDKPEDEAKLRIMRWSAMALGVTILPLGVIAAISTGLRIGQYGLTPERLWAVTFTAIACAYGLAYLVSAVRGRVQGWTAFVRPANMRLAVGLCALAFLLSTPLISFGSISTRNQLARLENGKVTVKNFDFAALRFDFGPAGMKALKKLEKEGRMAEIRSRASNVLKRKDRYIITDDERREEFAANIVVYPARAHLPSELKQRLTDYFACGDIKPCNVIYLEDTSEAILARQDNGGVLALRDGKWVDLRFPVGRLTPDEVEAINTAFAQGRVEIREVERRQVFVDGKPVGAAFE